MKRIFIIFLLIVNVGIAQTAGNTGTSFLKLGSGARNIAMSDLGVIGGTELTAVNYNPSLLSLISKTQLSFTHNNLLEDFSSELLSGSFSAFGLPFAINVNTTSIDNIEIRTQPGDVESKFDAHYFSTGLSTSFLLMNGFHAGVTIKYIYENLYTDEASGIGFDFGVTYSGFVEGLFVGASLRNLGSMSKLRNESSPLPKDLRFGISYLVPIAKTELTLSMIGGFQKYLDADNSHFHIGAEIGYDELFFIRAGYVSGSETKNISTGFGLKWRSINLDYAYVPVKYGLGENHIITFIFTF